MLKIVAFAFAILSASEALRCYLGQQNASDPVEGEPGICLANSMSCVTIFDIKANTATRYCQISNCTINGFLTSSPACVNSTSTGHEPGFEPGRKIVSCCCYGDGCNTKSRNDNGQLVENMKPDTDPEETNLAASIAGRIEDFYERDAVSSERTFIRRVVKHIYKHVNDADDGRKGKW